MPVARIGRQLLKGDVGREHGVGHVVVVVAVDGVVGERGARAMRSGSSYAITNATQRTYWYDDQYAE